MSFQIHFLCYIQWALINVAKKSDFIVNQVEEMVATQGLVST